MKRFEKLISFLFMFLLFSMVFVLVMNVEPSSVERSTNLPIKTSATTIAIDGNTQLANNATSGSGNSTHPYILENYVIDGTGLGVNCIDIRNTDAHFILRMVRSIRRKPCNMLGSSSTNRTRLAMVMLLMNSRRPSLRLLGGGMRGTFLSSAPRPHPPA